MHALQRLLRDGLARRGWNQSDLARESGLSKQVVSKLLRDDRAPVSRLLKSTTVDGLARALQVDSGVVRAAIAEEMGLPGSEVQVVFDARGVADDDLIRELARRLGAATAGAVGTVGTPAGPGGSSLTLVRTVEDAEVAEQEAGLGAPPAPSAVAWAARTGEPDQVLDLHEDGAVHLSDDAQDDPEAPAPA